MNNIILFMEKLNKKGQQTMGLPFGMIFNVASETRLAGQNCFTILDWKISGSEFQNFRFVKTGSTGGVL